jgi:hypothetical protein
MSSGLHDPTFHLRACVAILELCKSNVLNQHDLVAEGGTTLVLQAMNLNPQVRPRQGQPVCPPQPRTCAKLFRSTRSAELGPSPLLP